MQYQYDVQVKRNSGEWVNLNMQPAPSKEEAEREAERWSGVAHRVVRREFSDWEPLDKPGKLTLKIADRVDDNGMVSIVVHEGPNEFGSEVDWWKVSPAGLGESINARYSVIRSIGNMAYEVEEVK